MPEPNLAPTPKFRFRESPNNISEHRTMIESRPFQRAIDFALLNYQLAVAQTVTDNPQNAAYAGLKMAGVQEFLFMLKTLSEEPRIVRTVKEENLDHKA